MKTHQALVLCEPAPSPAGQGARSEQCQSPGAASPQREGMGGLRSGTPIPALPCPSWLFPLVPLKGLHPWKCFQFLVGLVEGGLNKREKKLKKENKKEVKSARLRLFCVRAALVFLQAELRYLHGNREVKSIRTNEMGLCALPAGSPCVDKFISERRLLFLNNRF